MKRRALLDEVELRRLMTEPTEGEHLEFKRALLGRKEIGEYAVGIGNEGGGWLILGVSDRRPRKIVGIELPDASELQRIRDAVFDSGGVRVDLAPISTAEGDVLAVRVPSRPRGQLFFTKGGKFLMRTGEVLRGMTFAEITRIRAEEVGERDWSAEEVAGDWRELIDPLEVERLRRVLRDQQRADLAGLEYEALLRSLELLVRTRSGLRSTRAGIVLLGRSEAIRSHAPNHEVKLQRFDRDELFPDLSEDSREGVLAILQRAAEVIEAVNTSETIQAGLFRIDVPKFPRLAYREAVVNALTHRDYDIGGNVAVRTYANRIEIGSPGGWYGGVNERNLLNAESKRRNELLAAVLQRIGLAERSALGVKRMFREMLSAGKQAPEYRSTASSVTVTLRDGTFDHPFAALVRQATEEGRSLGVFDLLLLAHLRTHRELTVKEGAELCQTTEAEARRLLDALRNQVLLDRIGSGRGTKYVLGTAAYDLLELAEERPRDLGISARTFEGLLIDELERKGAEGLTPREIREWSRYARAQTTRLLGDLVKRGVIVSSGKRGKGARYWHPRYPRRAERSR